jgi:hypothetical protein
MTTVDAKILNTRIDKNMPLEVIRQFIHGEDSNCDQYDDLPSEYRDQLLQAEDQAGNPRYIGKTLKDVSSSDNAKMLDTAMDYAMVSQQATEEDLANMPGGANDRNGLGDE